MKKAFFIDGGAGRVIAAIPALIKYVQQNPNHDVRIFVGGWDSLLWGIPELHDKVFSMDQKGNFETRIRDVDELISPEPYRLPSYFNLKTSLVEAFDEIINDTTDHSDLGPPTLILSKMEEKQAANVIAQAKSTKQKNRTIVVQPFGRSAQRVDQQDIIDESSRSLEPHVYLKLIKKLSVKYNTIFFGEEQFYVPGDDYTMKVQGNPDLRNWAAIIEAADYFVGCDSVGQHMARALNKPGTVIIGSTYPENTSYPDYFNIIEKADANKVFSPIRISGLESHLADRMNDRCMEFTDGEVDSIYSSIVEDIEKKVGK